MVLVQLYYKLNNNLSTYVPSTIPGATCLIEASQQNYMLGVITPILDEETKVQRG